jgi:hypothetical protein
MEVKDRQPPEYKCMVGLAPPPKAAFDIEIVGKTDCATKLYQTSAEAGSSQVTATPDIVEFTKVPEMLLQLVLLVSEIAPVQSSLVGGRVALVVRQILKLATVPNPEASAPALFEILTKYVVPLFTARVKVVPFAQLK